MHGTLVHLFAVGTTGEIARMVSLILPCKVHRPSAVCALDQSSEYLCRTILALPAAADDLLLHLIKHIPADDGLMGSLHSNPFRDRIPSLLFQFERFDGRFIVDTIAKVVLIC